MIEQAEVIHTSSKKVDQPANIGVVGSASLAHLGCLSTTNPSKDASPSREPVGQYVIVPAAA